MTTVFHAWNNLLEEKMSKIETSINNIKSDFHTVQDEFKNDIMSLNITKYMTKTELSKVNCVLKEIDSSQHLLGEKYENEKEKVNNNK